MKSTFRQYTTALLRHISSAMCLLAYLWTATPLMPLGTAMVAWLDGDHRVSVAIGNGGMNVVLRHDASDARTALTHTHCLASRALTLLAESSGPVHSDHVIHFQSGGATALRAAPWRVSAPLVEFTLASACATALALPSALASPEVPLRAIPPPASSVSVVRATVFHI